MPPSLLFNTCQIKTVRLLYFYIDADCILLSGCDLWSFHLNQSCVLHLPLLGNLWPLPAHQLHLPRRGTSTAPLSQLHIPRARPLHHHTGGHYNYPGSRGWVLRGILGERAAWADVWAPGDVTCTSTHTDSKCTFTGRCTLCFGSRGINRNPANNENTESPGALSLAQSAKMWQPCEEEERDWSAV